MKRPPGLLETLQRSRRIKLRKGRLALLIVMILSVSFPGPCLTSDTPVQRSHLIMIESLFKKSGLTQASVSLDRQGRIELKGGYLDRRDVDLAFSLAQTVVGVKWVSPVTPENIKVKEWESKLSGLFPKKKGTEQPAPRLRVPDTISRTGENSPRTSDAVPPGRIAAKYAIVIGVSKFQEKSITPLQYAQKDAKDFYDYLVSPSGCGFNKENAILLINEDATRAKIADALESVRRRAEKDDLVIIYVSSHGTPPAPFGGVYIVTYDSIVKPRQSVWETSVSNEMLRDFINGVKAERLLVIMDACYSNGAYSRVDGFLPTGGKSLGEGDEEGYGRSRSFMTEKILGAKDIVLDDEPVQAKGAMQSDSGWGRVLFSSSDDGEKSWESDTLRNSYFTYYFIEGLRKYGGAKEAFNYAKPKVTAGVLSEKQADQHPQAAADRKDWNIVLK